MWYNLNMAYGSTSYGSVSYGSAKGGFLIRIFSKVIVTMKTGLNKMQMLTRNNKSILQNKQSAIMDITNNSKVVLNTKENKTTI